MSDIESVTRALRELSDTALATATALESEISAAAELIRTSGVIPVIAHPERYHQATPTLVSQWRSVGAVIQMDAIMVFGNAPMSRLARKLLEDGLVDCIASDTHGDSRSLKAARDWLEAIDAHEQAELLCTINARRLLNRDAVLPVMPIPPTDSGMLSKLKTMFMRRS